MFKRWNKTFDPLVSGWTNYINEVNAPLSLNYQNENLKSKNIKQTSSKDTFGDTISHQLSESSPFSYLNAIETVFFSFEENVASFYLTFAKSLIDPNLLYCFIFYNPMSPLVRYLRKDSKIHAWNYTNKSWDQNTNKQKKTSPPIQTVMQFINFKGSTINIYNYLLQMLFVFYAFAVPPSANGFPQRRQENSSPIAYFIFGEVSFFSFVLR